jgi:hypothetical protein
MSEQLVWHTPLRRITLRKGKHTFIASYEKGCERQMVESLKDKAARRENGFDWFDAMVMAHEMSRHTGKDIRLIGEKV